MYIAAVVLFMFVFPSISVVVETLVLRSHPGFLTLVGKWFVFWGVGVRLLTAGIRQIVRPDLTAEGIFGIKNRESLILVQELGFATFAIGVLGVWTILRPTWALPAAIVAGLFYGLAGARHAMKGGRNRDENVAMVSDLFIFAIMLVAFCSRISS